MPTVLDRVFDDVQTDPPPVHPRVRHWRNRLARGTQLGVEVVRSPEALGERVTELVVSAGDGDTDPPEVFAWDDELNAALVQLGIRATDRTNEEQRFALGLRAAVRKATREFGDGFVNSVLLELVNESDLSRHASIADVVKHAHALAPNRDSKRYTPCREMIADAISGRMYELKSDLKYSPADARDILVAALARFLDERFTVSSRRRLGLL
jgi:hypothetical protein